MSGVIRKTKVLVNLFSRFDGALFLSDACGKLL